MHGFDVHEATLYLFCEILDPCQEKLTIIGPWGQGKDNPVTFRLLLTQIYA